MDKTVTTIKNAIVAYSVHVVFQNFTKQFRRYLIDHRHSVVSFFPVSTLENSSNQEDVCETVNVEKLSDSYAFALSNELPVSAVEMPKAQN